MTFTFDQLATKHQWPLTGYHQTHLDSLSTWFQDNMSLDSHPDGFQLEHYLSYRAEIEEYVDHVLPALANQLPLENLTPVQYAARHGYHRWLEKPPYSLSSMVNQASSNGVTPLHLAANYAQFHTVSVLVQQLHADVSARDCNQQLPIQHALHLSIQYPPHYPKQKQAIVRYLLDAAPDTISHQDSSGNTVFHGMVLAGFEELLAKLLPEQLQAANIANHYGHYPIHTALLNAQTSLINIMLKSKEMASLTDTSGRTALHYAAEYRDADTVTACCLASADIKLKDRSGKTALMLALDENNQAAVDVLRKFGA